MAAFESRVGPDAVIVGIGVGLRVGVKVSVGGTGVADFSGVRGGNVTITGGGIVGAGFDVAVPQAVASVNSIDNTMKAPRAGCRQEIR